MVSLRVERSPKQKRSAFFAKRTQLFFRRRDVQRPQKPFASSKHAQQRASHPFFVAALSFAATGLPTTRRRGQAAKETFAKIPALLLTTDTHFGLYDRRKMIRCPNCGLKGLPPSTSNCPPPDQG
jgi:hypothetical protein